MQVTPLYTVDLTSGDPMEQDGVLVPQNATAFQDLVVWKGAPGGLAIYCNEYLKQSNNSAKLVYPLSIDWQLLRGLGGAGGSRNPRTGCVWDPAPLAIGTTNIASEAQMQREGLMFQTTGVVGEFWLLRGRLQSVTGGELSISLWAQRCTGCASGAVPRIDTGNMIG